MPISSSHKAIFVFSLDPAFSDKIVMKTVRIFYLSFFCSLSLTTIACSSMTSREQIEAKQDRARPRAAAYAADGFMMDSRSPEDRPFHAWEFYYKHCALVSRNPVPNKAEYNCSDPY